MTFMARMNSDAQFDRKVRSMSIVRAALLCAILGVLPEAAVSQPSEAEWINDLRSGGYVIVFRHGATYSDQANADSMSRPNVSAQRQLNDQGRAQARSIGESMRKLKIPVGRVLTSTTQRAVDTARLLGFGDVTATPDLTESGPAASPDENNRRAQALRKLAAGRPPADSNLVIVSHKPNIVEAFGGDWLDVREGEASVFEPDGNGGFKLVVRIQAREWSKLAQASN
jgi:phosphohistidine phosphatase SixA